MCFSYSSFESGLITILQGGVDVWRYDIEIPMKYGVDYCVGDTRGPAGIFRFLRTAPVLLSIIRDVEELCPNAVVLNYTNPMAMLVSYLQRQTDIKITGLCHSVQGTAQMLERWLGLKAGELDYTCVGINHQAFYLKLQHDGKDMYPALREAVKRPEVAAEEPVRIEVHHEDPNQVEVYEEEYEGEGFRYELDAFLRAVRGEGKPVLTEEQSVWISSVLERYLTWRKEEKR